MDSGFQATWPEWFLDTPKAPTAGFLGPCSKDISCRRRTPPKVSSARIIASWTQRCGPQFVELPKLHPEQEPQTTSFISVLLLCVVVGINTNPEPT